MANCVDCQIASNSVAASFTWFCLPRINSLGDAGGVQSLGADISRSTRIGNNNLLGISKLNLPLPSTDVKINGNPKSADSQITTLHRLSLVNWDNKSSCIGQRQSRTIDF